MLNAKQVEKWFDNVVEETVETFIHEVNLQKQRELRILATIRKGKLPTRCSVCGEMGHNKRSHDKQAIKPVDKK